MGEAIIVSGNVMLGMFFVGKWPRPTRSMFPFPRQTSKSFILTDFSEGGASLKVASFWASGLNFSPVMAERVSTFAEKSPPLEGDRPLRGGVVSTSEKITDSHWLSGARVSPNISRKMD